jgi:hypothetical protein
MDSLLNAANRIFGSAGKNPDGSASPVKGISGSVYSQQAANMPYAFAE